MAERDRNARCILQETKSRARWKPRSKEASAHRFGICFSPVRRSGSTAAGRHEQKEATLRQARKTRQRPVRRNVKLSRATLLPEGEGLSSRQIPLLKRLSL